MAHIQNNDGGAEVFSPLGMLNDSLSKVLATLMGGHPTKNQALTQIARLQSRVDKIETLMQSHRSYEAGKNLDLTR